MMATRAAAILLAIGAAGGLLGWQIQGRAAHDLRLAHDLQSRETGSEGEPPSAEDNAEIIEVLGQAIELRRSIEEILVSIETDVGFLRSQQERAALIPRQAADQLSMIGASLASSIAASGESIEGLSELQGGLRRSARLAWAIARELEELDRKMGPTVGGRP
jgi:hypothetical protein